MIKAEGPERIAPEWWRNPSYSKEEGSDGPGPSGPIASSVPQSGPLSCPPSFRERGKARPRDYYRIEDEDGHRFWVFREGLYQESEFGSPGWYLHGVFG